ncbi:MAG: phosphoribosylaminoimidazolesuccinocarboxamide synthase [Candidatus Bathyarchaeota archaeon]|nr:phosphoribosylaminoimidazolesuccinocarboxamide synthase [Candidatus Termiticorpusculum sp.]
MGSVKDLHVITPATCATMGLGRFDFSDRFSVFDWGEMPDHIDGKGAALAVMGAYCFEQLERVGVRTHYRGLVNESGKAVRVGELKDPSNVMEITLVNVYRPKITTENGKFFRDYSVYTSELKNCLIPLELIYRNGLPEGSSVFKCLAQGRITLQDIGLDHQPRPGETLEKPVFGVSTKLEESDRYITWLEAKQISGLSDSELTDIKAVLLKADEVVTQAAGNAGLKTVDGKIELAFDEKRKLMVVDVVGTLDECRFTYGDIHVSKEVARQFYKKTPWYADVEETKKHAEVNGIKEWKTLCKSQPPKLDITLKRLISEMYMSVANEMTGLGLFDSPRLGDVISEYQEYMDEKV